MKNTKNLGMFLETIINNSIDYYEKNMIAIFRKQNVPIKIKKITNNDVLGILISKCDVDYYGIVDGKFIAIEAKQTNLKYFNLRNVLSHQIDFLENVIDLKGISYLIIYFQISNKFYLVNYKNIKNDARNLKKRIKEEWFNKNCIILNLVYPGRLDFIKHIKNEITSLNKKT